MFTLWPGCRVLLDLVGQNPDVHLCSDCLSRWKGTKSAPPRKMWCRHILERRQAVWLIMQVSLFSWRRGIWNVAENLLRRQLPMERHFFQ